MCSTWAATVLRRDPEMARDLGVRLAVRDASGDLELPRRERRPGLRLRPATDRAQDVVRGRRRSPPLPMAAAASRARVASREASARWLERWCAPGEVDDRPRPLPGPPPRGPSCDGRGQGGPRLAGRAVAEGEEALGVVERGKRARDRPAHGSGRRSPRPRLAPPGRSPSREVRPRPGHDEREEVGRVVDGRRRSPAVLDETRRGGGDRPSPGRPRRDPRARVTAVAAHASAPRDRVLPPEMSRHRRARPVRAARIRARGARSPGS